MGGYGSGRSGACPTSEATASFVLSMRLLTRGGLGPGTLGTVRVSFGEQEFPVRLIVDMRTPRASYVEFSHETRQWNAQRVTYRVWLATTRPNFGGHRWWFVCPRTGRFAAKLFLPNGGWYFWSRAAYGLGFASQRESRIDRLYRRARRLHRAAGGDPGDHWEVPPEKPKWMRCKTYERRYAAWEAAAEAADQEFTFRAARIIGWV